MSPKMKKVFQVIARLFTRKEKEVPENQDALGAYPLRMQISAIPERRYLRTARLLAVISFLNMAVLILLSGIFIYWAVRRNVIIEAGNVQIYAMKPEYKIIQPLERAQRVYPANYFILEQAVRDYITSRYTVYLDRKKQEDSRRYVNLYMHGDKLDEFYKREQYAISEPARRKGVNREVHIYSLRETPVTGLWEALVDIFDMKPRDSHNPVCDCYDNSKECLKCKEELNLGRARYRMYVRAGFGGPASGLNPLGIKVDGIYVTPQVVRPKEIFWNIPSVLKPEL